MPSAQDNLEDIIYYIALDSPTRATSVTKELMTSISNTLSLLINRGVVAEKKPLTIIY
jgi:plasmid stabilization system protein ParE